MILRVAQSPLWLAVSLKLRRPSAEGFFGVG